MRPLNSDRKRIVERIRKVRALLRTVIPALSIMLSVCVLTGCEKKSAAPKLASNDAAETDDSKTANENQPAHPAVNARYVPDQQCAECHHDIWDTYQHVGMSNSCYEFKPTESIEDFENNHFFHAASNKHYEMSVEDGQFVMTRYRVRKNGERTGVHKQTADFVIGSGNHARTYFFREPSGAMYQLPVVWYSQQSKWGMAPGYDHANHDDFARPITRECMFCHNAFPNYEAGSDLHGMPDRFPETLPHGIGCQRCHGPGSEHIRVAELNSESPDVITSIVNPSRLENPQRDDVCNQCHLQPTSARTSFLRTFDRGVYSFRPGEKLADYQSYFEFPDAEENDLFEINHHPYRMYQSKCFLASDGKLNCLSCHDPHAKIPAANRASHYRARCLNCHGSNDCLDVELGRQPNANCVQCHMPERRTEDVVHVTMTDHKITRHSDFEKNLSPLTEYKVAGDRPIRSYATPGAAKKSINPVQAISRSIARLRDHDPNSLDQLYRQIKGGVSSSDEPKIELAQSLLEIGESAAGLGLLDSISESAKETSLVQSNLGLGYLQSNQFAEAFKHFEKAIVLEPVRPEAHFNLGITYINSGDLKRAIIQFERAVKLKPNFDTAWFTLGSALKDNENFELAEKRFQRTLQLNPDYPGAHLSLANVQRFQEKHLESIATLKDGRISQPANYAIAKELGLTLLESVSNDLVESHKSLQSVIDLVGFKQPDTELPLMLATALLQNGSNEDALKAIGSVDETERNPDRLLVAAIGQAKLNQTDQAMKLYQSAKQKMKNDAQPPGRLRTVILKIADSVGALAVKKD